MVDIVESIKWFFSAKESGYTFENTFLYAIILIVAAYLVFEALKKLKVKIDKRLALSAAPFVVWGGALRSLQDAGTINSYWFFTPGIYFFVFLVIFSTLLISLLLQKKFRIPYYKPVIFVGTFLVVGTIGFIQFKNWYGLVLVSVFLAPFAIGFLIYKKWKLENKIVSITQMFDAVTTFVSLQYFGYAEQHVLPNIFIWNFGPASFIPLKLVGVVLILYLIDRYSEDKEFNNYIKLIIAILGGATGSRDLFSMLSFV
jgi:uncharacterized membrane protein